MNDDTDFEKGKKRRQTPTAKVLSYWRTYIVIFLPFLLLPVPCIFQSPKVSCAYIMVVMAVFWVTEALPLAVTSLLPVVLVPLFGIMPSKALCPNYTKDTIMLFLGGLVVAVCVEHWNLHKRIALKVLLLVGTAPQLLMLGFMLPTWFLSMWISNTATTAMMIPIVAAVLEEMRKGEQYTQEDLCLDEKNKDGERQSNLSYSESSLANGGFKSDERSLDIDRKDCSAVGSTENIISDSSLSSTVTAESDGRPVDAAYLKLCKAMSLCVAYAANCGGIATLTGTGPNLVLKGQLDILFGEVGVSFSSWMLFALPISFLSLFVAWFWLQLMFLGCKTFTSCRCRKRNNDAAIKSVIRREYQRLGPWSFAEISILCIFICLAFLWLTRSPEFIPGWADLFPKGYVSDATAAMFIALLLFFFPSQPPSCWGKGKAPVPPLLTWETVSHKLPWNVILLLGGGFALADSSKVSGLSEWVGEQLIIFERLPPTVIAILLSTIIAALTEVTSNTATATLMLPIIADLAININLNPLFLMLPATVSASFAFMLPVATPPNAIVFSYGHLRIKDMAMAGILMNIVCILIVTLGISTWGAAFFELNTFPEWATAASVMTTTLDPCAVIANTTTTSSSLMTTSA